MAAGLLPFAVALGEIWTMVRSKHVGVGCGKCGGLTPSKTRVLSAKLSGVGVGIVTLNGWKVYQP
eukprot:scaffold249308_cov70-Cyclotella_meneghiniana.AAC.14